MRSRGTSSSALASCDRVTGSPAANSRLSSTDVGRSSAQTDSPAWPGCDSEALSAAGLAPVSVSNAVGLLSRGGMYVLTNICQRLLIVSWPAIGSPHCLGRGQLACQTAGHGTDK